jgi:hypothetical protein
VAREHLQARLPHPPQRENAVGHGESYIHAGPVAIAEQGGEVLDLPQIGKFRRGQTVAQRIEP